MLKILDCICHSCKSMVKAVCQVLGITNVDYFLSLLYFGHTWLYQSFWLSEVKSFDPLLTYLYAFGYTQLQDSCPLLNMKKMTQYREIRPIIPCFKDFLNIWSEQLH